MILIALTRRSSSLAQIVAQLRRSPVGAVKARRSTTERGHHASVTGEYRKHDPNAAISNKHCVSAPPTIEPRSMDAGDRSCRMMRQPRAALTTNGARP